jgi:hypothetical protein
MPTHVVDKRFPAFDIDEAMEVNENMEEWNYGLENIRSGEHRICLSFSTAVDENGNDFLHFMASSDDYSACSSSNESIEVYGKRRIRDKTQHAGPITEEERSDWKRMLEMQRRS